MAERTDVATRMREDDTFERSAEEIRQDIAARRESISETVDRLGDRIHETLDWREYVAEYPYVALGLAAGVGFLIAGIFKFKHEPTPRERIMDALAEITEDLTDRVRGSIEDVVPKKGGPGKTIKAAATAAVTKAALDFAKKKANEAFAGRSQEQTYKVH
ncbi:MAG TPA: DUF3618 domain-containing protein [Blastocatellia bacterium]|nr:DUF3618 domain-containing protein [Blastocatellia bacterium]